MPGRLPIVADGLNVPWAVGGLRIERDGTKNNFQGEWPNVHFSSLRLWDSRTAWLDLEPAKGQWAFDHLDALVTKAETNGVSDVLMVLGGTPTWAATKVLATDAAWMGPGSASMPASLDDWRTYVSTVATRYKGRIAAYEIGNEPNFLTYWSGTPAEYRDFVSTAAAAIRAADPDATIVMSGGIIRNKWDVLRIEPWLTATAPLAASNAVDGLALHIYPASKAMASSPALVKSLVGQVNKSGWGRLPRWVTEINVTDAAAQPPTVQVKDVRDLVQTTQDNGFERLYWYAWTDLGPADLIQFHPGEEGAAALEVVNDDGPVGPDGNVDGDGDGAETSGN
jgi:hypothetical protein